MSKLLSDENILEIARKLAYMDNLTFARAIEAAVLEAQGKQKPVAFVSEGYADNGDRVARLISHNLDDAKSASAAFAKHYPTVKILPLYAAPVVLPHNGIASTPKQVDEIIDAICAPVVQPDDSKDAERYRWLRDSEIDRDLDIALWDGDNWMPWYGEPEGLDAAIDAAMAAEKE